MGSKKDELMAKYAADIRNKFKQEPDLILLEKVVDALGPAIYNRDASTVSSSSESELETVKQNFLIKKLGLEDSDALMTAINKTMNQYGTSVRTKYRAVVYYILAGEFNKEGVYD